MSAEVATLDKVRAAADTLRSQGLPATADRVVRMIGGSKATVLAHLRTLRNDTATHAEIPAHILDMARQVSGEAFRAGRAAEAETVKDATARLSAALRDQDGQIDELEEANARLTTEVRRLGEELQKSGEGRADALRRAERLQAERDALVGELSAERARSSASLSDALSRIETMVAQATPKAAQRGTLSLRSGRGNGRDSRRDKD